MNRIKIVLEDKGIKQTWLADQLDKSFNTINGYVQNRHQPRLEVLFEIAKILEVDPKELIQSENIMSKITLSQLEQYLSKAAWILKGPVDASDFKVYIFPSFVLQKNIRCI